MSVRPTSVGQTLEVSLREADRPPDAAFFDVGAKDAIFSSTAGTSSAAKENDTVVLPKATSVPRVSARCRARLRARSMNARPKNERR